MILKCKLYTLSLLTFLTIGCGNYSFTGASIPDGTESFQVNLFENNSGNNVGSIFEPGLDRDFTIALQNILENQTNLEMLQNDGDLVYEGEIITRGQPIAEVGSSGKVTKSQLYFEIRQDNEALDPITYLES